MAVLRVPLIYASYICNAHLLLFPPPSDAPAIAAAPFFLPRCVNANARGTVVFVHCVSFERASLRAGERLLSEVTSAKKPRNLQPLRFAARILITLGELVGITGRLERHE